jgi:hypothetical protein
MLIWSGYLPGNAYSAALERHFFATKCSFKPPEIPSLKLYLHPYPVPLPRFFFDLDADVTKKPTLLMRYQPFL